MAQLITDRDTNFVYFSEWITTRRKYWPEIKKALDKYSISMDFLPRYSSDKRPLSRDIWARDYMPIQLGETKFLGFRYEPDYLMANSKDQNYISDYAQILTSKNMTASDKTSLVIDGGNMVKCGNCIIMTRKVFDANPTRSEKSIRDELEEKFGVKIVFISCDKENETFWVKTDNGQKVNRPLFHSDGVVRWVKDDVVIVNKSGYNYTSKVLKELKDQGLEPELLDYSQKGEYVSVNSWCYLNFLRIGNKIFVPCYHGKEEEIALKKLESIYIGCKIEPVQLGGILKDGGGLNCITWNIRK